MSKYLHRVVAPSNGVLEQILGRFCSSNVPPDDFETRLRDVLSFTYSTVRGIECEPFPFETLEGDKIVKARLQLFKQIISSLSEAALVELRYDSSVGNDLIFLTVTYEPKPNIPNPHYR